MLDHEREVTPDWLQREQAVGYVTYVDRFAGTLAGVREKLPYLRELGVTYLHLMPLLHARPAPNDGGYAVVDYGAVEPVTGDAGRPPRAGRPTCARPGWRCASTSCSTTSPPSTRGRATRLSATFPDRDRARRVRAHAARRLPGHRARAASRGPTRTAWVWTTFNTYQWDLDYTNPDVFVAMASAMLDLAAVGRRRAAPGRRAVPVEAARDELPEPARGPRAAAGLPGGDADRRARGRLQGRGDRRPARPRPLPRDRRATRARSATSPTTTC